MSDTAHQDNSFQAVQQVLDRLSARKDSHEAMRLSLLETALKSIPFEGCTPLMMDQATKETGLTRDQIDLAFPGGVIDLLDFWHDVIDEVMLNSMLGKDFNTLKIREKITLSLQSRLKVMTPHKEASRRAAATLALPIYASRAAKLGWRTADRIWAALGDTSLDFNFYSKRTILLGVWTSTLAKWFADESENHNQTFSFLDDRIANVMEIEKFKANWRKRDINPGKFMQENFIPSLAKMRYPSR